MVGRGRDEPLGARARGRRDAVRGRSGGSGARRAARRCARDDVHREPGAPADAAGDVQDRRRAAPVRDPRRRPRRRRPRALDLRRPLRHLRGAADRLRDSRRRLGAGGAGHGRARLHDDHRDPCPVPPLLRRVPHLARDQRHRGALRRRPARARRRRARRRREDAGALARPSEPARLGPEPRRLLPGARSIEPVLRGGAAAARGGDAPLRRAHRPQLPAVRVPRPSRGGACGRRDGLGDLDDRGRRAEAQRGGRARRARHGAPVPAILGPPPRGRPAVLDSRDCGARPHEGLRRGRRAAVRRRRHGAPRGGPAAAHGHRRPLRARVEGVHPGDGACRLRRARRRGDARRRARAPRPRRPPAPALHRRHRGRRLGHESRLRPRVADRAARDRVPVLRARLRRHGRREQELGEDHRRRGRPVRPGVLRVRLEEVGRRHGLASALRRRPDRGAVPHRGGRLRRVPSVLAPRARRRARARAGRRDVPSLESVRLRDVEAPAAAGAGADHREGARLLRRRREAGGARRRHAGPREHCPPDVFLRAQRRPARRRCDRGDQAHDREDVPPQGRRDRAAQLRRRRRRPRRAREDRTGAAERHAALRAP